MTGPASPNNREWLTKKELRARVDELYEAEGRYIEIIAQLRAQLQEPPMPKNQLTDAEQLGDRIVNMINEASTQTRLSTQDLLNVCAIMVANVIRGCTETEYEMRLADEFHTAVRFHIGQLQAKDADDQAAPKPH